MTLERQSCRWTAAEENQDGAVTGAQWVEVELVDTCRWTGKSMHVRSDGGVLRAEVWPSSETSILRTGNDLEHLIGVCR